MIASIEQRHTLAEITWTADRLLDRGHHRAMLALCNRALVDHGDLPDLRLRRARALMALHRADEAERDLAMVLCQRPESSTAHLLLCEIALCRGDLDRAEELLDRAIDLDPSHPRTVDLADVVQGWRQQLSAYRCAA